jgi:ATP-dependent Clp protease ATP-binding subunit ClpB
MDLTEPVGAELEEIALHGARDLEESYGVRIDPAAVRIAIDMSSKYRMARYLLRAHSTPPMLAELEGTSCGRRRIIRK